MHEIAIRPDVIETIRKRRGGRYHVYEQIDPARTGLIVIDMQNFFVAPGTAGEVPAARDIVGNINRLAAAMRAADGTVVWVVSAFTEAHLDQWSVLLRDFCSPERSAAILADLREGAPGHELWHEIRVGEGDWTVTKDRFSAMIQGSSDLEPRLRAHNIDTIVIAGTLTNVCCESTARDAMMRNFKTIVVSDGNAALTDEDHNASLSALFQTFADVMTTDEVIARLSKSVAAAE